jgi:hypothetical protein
MNMAILSQNQFTITTLKGTLDSGSSITCQYYSVDPAVLIEAGEFVVLADVTAATAPAVSVVEKGMAKSDKYLGMVLTNPLKQYWASGEKLEVAILGTIAMVETSAAVAAGASLAYDPATKQVAAAGGGESVVGLAMEKAPASGTLIRALIQTIFA